MTTDYQQALSGAVTAWHRRDLLAVSGPDASTFLHGQLSQDIATMVPGQSRWSFLLQPHGKVDAFLRISCQEPTRFLIDVDSGFGSLVAARLERFRLRTKVDIETLPWGILAVRGPESHKWKSNSAFCADATWAGVPGLDLIGPELEIPEDLEVVDSALLELLRIEGGQPAMGSEINDKTIPAELGLNDLAVSFDKGCYTGQELVARIDSRGNKVPRRLRGVIINSTDADELWRGSTLASEGRSLATISSAMYSPRFDAIVGLALVRRDGLAISEASVEVDEASYSATICDLPLQASS